MGDMNKLSTTLELTFVASPNLYHAVRAGFVNQGTSLNKWCIARGINRQTAEKALKGDRHSKMSRALLAELLGAALPGRKRA